MKERRCSCGAAMKIAAVDVGHRYKCPTCAAQDFERETFELSENELKGESPLVYLARRRTADEQTVELEAQGGAPTTETRALGSTKPSERHSARAPGSSVPPPPSLVSGVSSTPAPAAAQPSTPGAGMGDTSQLALGLLPIGSRLASYRITETLGHGGMGVVYKAHDERLDRAIALKVLSRQLTASRQFVDRFYREARAAAALSHPNITVIYFVGDEERTYFYAMEYVEGKNLADVVKEHGRFPSGRALEVLRQCALGLKAAAAVGIVHRDVKPSNILLRPDGQVKITDFGLAKAIAASALELTSTGVVMGTPTYMSPEQARGAQVDLRSDIYSLGATVYHLLYGVAPFEADSPISLILRHLNDPVVFPKEPPVPEDVKALISRMLEKDAERRFATYDLLLEQVERLLRGEALARETPSKRIVVLRHKRDRGTAKRSLFKVGKLSVAKTSLKLGRRDKAISLLRETLDEAGDADLRAEAALLLLDIYEKDGDQAEATRMASMLAEVGKDAAQAYAAWKLAVLDERAAIERERSALSRYERILRDPPEGMPRPLVEAQVKRLRTRIESAQRELDTTQIILEDTEGST